MRSKGMEKIALWGIALILALTISCGKAEVSSSDIMDKVVVEKVANETHPGTASDNTIKQPSTTEEEAGDVSQIAERRMSLYDFFFGNNNNNNNNHRTTEIQTPTILPGQQPQVQVHENPNQLMYVRETSFPNPNGGLLSRLILARRMARLQRLSNRLQILPAMFGLFRGQQQVAQQRTLNQRIGGQYQPEYNPADILLDGVGFKNASVSPHRQYSQARFNQNFANDVSFAQNSNLFGGNQPYPQTQTSLDEFERFNGNFGFRQNVPSFDQQQQGRQQENIYNQQQQQLLQNQQQQALQNQQQQALQNQQQPALGEQQTFYDQQQQLRQHQGAYDQNSQVQGQDKSLEQQAQVDHLQQHFDQQKQQLKYQQQLLEHQEQVRQQQQKLYEQQQSHLRQQQHQDQKQQQKKQQQDLYENQQQVQQKQAAPENYEQNTNQQLYDQQQLRLQQELVQQQDQLKKILFDQQQKLKLQDERFQQLQKQLLQEKKRISVTEN